jgi:hypothetical protein
MALGGAACGCLAALAHALWLLHAMLLLLPPACCCGRPHAMQESSRLRAQLYGFEAAHSLCGPIYNLLDK